MALTMRMLRAPNCANAPYRQYITKFGNCNLFFQDFTALQLRTINEVLINQMEGLFRTKDAAAYIKEKPADFWRAAHQHAYVQKSDKGAFMRDVNALHPKLQQKIAELKQLCEKNGLHIGIGECLRTAAEQDALYAQGRTKPGNRVTNAKGSSYSSQHQWGIAFDFYRNDGKGAYHNSDGFFQKTGSLAKSIGLGWGGDWKSPVDLPHLYLPTWGSTPTILKQQYGTPEQFRRTWVTGPLFTPGKSYKTSQACYLRSSPGTGNNKVSYPSLSALVKTKCRQTTDGFAVFRKGRNFRLKETKHIGQNVWGRMKSGYWVPLYYGGKIRVK